ncbi:MAG: hypothetical protein WB699_07290 [Bacteroidota bacterium]
MIRMNKRALFWAILLLTPFLVLGLVEAACRVGGFFAPMPFLIEVPNSNGTMVSFNALVASRYVDPSRVPVPMIAPESFSTQKAPGTFRVLCLGESSTAGFPFDCQVPFPKQLRQILAEAHPDRRIEVLNAGIAAISSYVIVDLMPELLKTAPDLVVVYTGHNEFYGVYGSGSALFHGSNDFLVRANLWVQGTRVGQMVKRFIAWAAPGRKSEAAGKTLMQSVVRDQEIPLGSPQFRNTMNVFRRNLSRIVELCEEHRIPVIVSNLVSNEADFKPFQSIVDSTHLPALHLRQVLSAGDSLVDAGEWRNAASRFAEVLGADSGNADAWYGMGRVSSRMNDTLAARRWFLGAIDRDGMRFRASGEENEIIREVALADGATFVDMHALFEEASPRGVIGKSLLCDHVHPNPQGYYLMAEALFGTIQQMRLLPAPVSGFRLPPTPYGVTDLDWDIGLMKIFVMTHRWPFPSTPVTIDDYQPHGDPEAARIARKYLFEDNVWSRAHEAMAENYIERGDFGGARREFAAIAVFAPDDPAPYRMIAETYGKEKNWAMQSLAYREALQRPGPKGLLAYHLALSQMQMGHLDNAIVVMEAATNAPELTMDQRQNARFYLAGFLSDAGQRDRALAMLRIILHDDPTYPPARTFLSQLERTPQQ